MSIEKLPNEIQSQSSGQKQEQSIGRLKNLSEIQSTFQKTSPASELSRPHLSNLSAAISSLPTSDSATQLLSKTDFAFLDQTLDIILQQLQHTIHSIENLRLDLRPLSDIGPLHSIHEELLRRTSQSDFESD